MSKSEKKIEIIAGLEDLKDNMEFMELCMLSEQYKSVCPDWFIEDYKEIRSSLNTLIKDYEGIV